MDCLILRMICLILRMGCLILRMVFLILRMFCLILRMVCHSEEANILKINLFLSPIQSQNKQR